jgi:hypothetical protein
VSRPAWFSLCKGNLWFSLAEGFVLLPRAWYVVVPGPAGGWSVGRVVAVNGGPSQVSGCCGSLWAADRPTSGRLGALAGVSGRAAASGVQPPGSLSGYSVPVCLSRMICSTALAV